MNNFEFLRPQNVQEACTMLSQHGDQGKIIAGGQSLLILLKQRLINPAYLINIKGVADLNYIRFHEKSGLRIGCLTTHRDLETSPVVREKYPSLAEMERRLASIQIRNWGTLGGNLCHGDPASDLAPCLIALDAEVKLYGPREERVVRIEEFFTDYYETQLKTDEILTEIRIPVSRGGGFYLKTNYRETDMAIAGVAALVTVERNDPDVCRDIRIVLGNAGSTPKRTIRGEGVLRGRRLDLECLEKAAQIAAEDAHPVSDIHASEEYKREMVKVLVKRTVGEAKKRARATAH